MGASISPPFLLDILVQSCLDKSMIELPSFDHIKDPEARAVIELLKVMLLNQQSLLEQQMAKIDELTRLLQGPKSERIPSVQSELQKKSEPSEEEKRKKKEGSNRKRRKNKTKKKEAPVEEVHHTIPEEDLKCEHCGDTEFEPLGEGELSHEYKFIPAQVIQLRHIREKKMCQCKKTILTAPAPIRVGEVCHHGPELHAHVAVSKCQDSIPLHRMAGQFQRSNLQMSKSTLCDMFHRTAEQLKPLYTRLMEKIQQSELLNGDETRIQVQQKGKTRTAWMWTFLSTTMIGFVFSFSRSGNTPIEVLSGTTGKLQVDGYTGYNQVCLPEGRERVGCWAHARRKFFNALSTAPQAEKALKLILELYRVEYKMAEEECLQSERHIQFRKVLSRHWLDKLREWLLERRDDTPPKSPFGQAVGYVLNQWEPLTRFVDDVRLPLDNNAAERALRPIALGRKNFLFVGNDRAGQNLAVLQSLVSTCMANGVNPQDYITDVLIRIQSHPMSRIDELLPMNWKPQA